MAVVSYQTQYLKQRVLHIKMSGSKPWKMKFHHFCKTAGRLVVKGWTQKNGLNYSETFSLIARFDSVCKLSAAADNDYEIYQLDVKTAFLSGEMNETIYMEQPDGIQDQKHRVCCLNKSLHGLKQAPRQWNTKLDGTFREFGLKPTTDDSCVYALSVVRYLGG